MKVSHIHVITSCWFLVCLMAATERVKNGDKGALLRQSTVAKVVVQRRNKHPNVVLKVKKSINHRRNGRKMEKSKRSSKRQFLPSLYPYFHPRVHRIVVHHHAVRTYCDPIPCQNGGTCTVVSHGYECTCPLGFMGTHCDVRSQCEPNPCRNGGTCYDVGQGYECTCARGYKGEHCEDINKCHPNPCRNGGTCTGTNDNTGFQCTCREGFKGLDCAEINYCAPNPCKNGATCTEKNGKYECTCLIGYKGVTCEERSICFSNPCANGGTCIDKLDGFRCNCKFGYHGDICQRHVCQPNPCQNGGTCIDENGHFRCVCMLGYHDEKCGMVSSCLSHPCLHDGTCVDVSLIRDNPAFLTRINLGDESFICKCKSPYTGRTCEDDTCRLCNPFAECLMGHCICKEGYHGDGKLCTKNVCHPNPCKNGGKCVPTDDAYDCDCPLGWTGPLCETRQPCIPNPCKNGGSCVPQENTYKCTCTSNFEGNDCEKANPCYPNPCLNGGQCKEMNGAATCECSVQFEGNRCEVDKCKKCDPNARCENGRCVCVAGYEGDGYTCTRTQGGGLPPGAASPCASSPCKNGGTCADIPGGGYMCKCHEGFSGQNCELGLGAKGPGPATTPSTKLPGGVGNGSRVCHPNPCLNGGTCKENGGGYDCICMTQFKGPNCEIDECEKCDVNAICLNGRCKCKHGYYGNGYECEKAEECSNCSPHATCHSGLCICVQPYAGNGHTCHIPPCNNCQPPNYCQSGNCVPFSKKFNIEKRLARQEKLKYKP